MASRIRYLDEIMDSGTLLWRLLFGCIGLGYFSYGRRQKQAVPWLCGLALMCYPYFVSNIAALVGIGLALSALPWFLRQ